MTGKQFFDWQTSGGTDDVMRLINILEQADVAWCAICGIAVNHWAEHPMVTQDVDLVVASDATERIVSLLEESGFRSERFAWSEPKRRQSKRIKDFADIARLIESHAELWEQIPSEVRQKLDMPERKNA